ncbi:hypothetical protein [Frankia sp. CcWB2]
MVFIDGDEHLRFFYRSLFKLEDIAEEIFFVHAEKAFPRLLFADGLTFRKFDGGYSLRDTAVLHLAALNDRFSDLFIAENGSSAQISARLGIAVSIEGRTRGSATLMRRRDVIFRGFSVRCEWHSKLEPHRNRIHFFPGDSRTDGKILVGMFVRHLPT